MLGLIQIVFCKLSDKIVLIFPRHIHFRAQIFEGFFWQRIKWHGDRSSWFRNACTCLRPWNIKRVCTGTNIEKFARTSWLGKSCNRDQNSAFGPKKNVLVGLQNACWLNCPLQFRSRWQPSTNKENIPRKQKSWGDREYWTQRLGWRESIDAVDGSLQLVNVLVLFVLQLSQSLPRDRHQQKCQKWSKLTQRDLPASKRDAHKDVASLG